MKLVLVCGHNHIVTSTIKNALNLYFLPIWSNISSRPQPQWDKICSECGICKNSGFQISILTHSPKFEAKRRNSKLAAHYLIQIHSPHWKSHSILIYLVIETPCIKTHWIMAKTSNPWGLVPLQLLNKHCYFYAPEFSRDFNETFIERL